MKRIIATLIILLSFISLKAEDQKRYMPDFFVSQFAGYIGFISGGLGYHLSEEKSSIEFLYGYVPAFAGGIEIHMLTTRINGRPFVYKSKNDFYFYPLNLAFFVNYTHGQQYKLKWSSKYPKWYYRPTALYSGESVGMAIKKACNERSIAAYEIYADLVTMSEFLYEYSQNDSVTFKDIISLAFGTRIFF